MDVKTAGKLGGLARAAALTDEQKKAASLKMHAARWGKPKADSGRRSKAKARAKAKLAAASRKANR